MTRLSLSLLGPFQATLDGQPITGFRTAKVRALLAYLAVEVGRPHPRTMLAALFWPERPERAALANLRNTLAILRKAVGDRRGNRDATPPHMLITRETIELNRDSDCWLDVSAFQALIETAADRPLNERLEEAIALYRGDFLAGFSVSGSPDFDDWVYLVRERLQRQVLDALRRLVMHYEGGGEFERACEAARRQVALAPWDEEAHRALMRMLARSGQRGAALAQYEACRQVLAEELGIEPGPETTAMYERIRERDLDPATLPPFLTATHADRRPPAPFVARERELAQLDGYLEGALAGRGRVVFVTGEAGTGKTALVGAFARRAESRHAGLVVAVGNCNAYTGAGDPYLPFREILAQLTGDVESRWAAGALSTQGARRLWRAMPLAVQALLKVGPGLIGALIAGRAVAARAATAVPRGAGWRDRLEALLAEQEPDRRPSGLRPADLCSQATAFLSALAQQTPLLLVLDDLQWADAESIDLLFHLGRRLDGSRILIAGIYRPSEVALERDGQRHPHRTSANATAFAGVLQELERQFGSISVHLDQVGERAFIEALLDSQPNRLGSAFRDALYEHTQGHALCVVEMLRDLQARGVLAQDEAGCWVEASAVDWASLPARCEGAIGARIDRLSVSLREMLKVACVEGDTFTAEVVARVQGAPALETVAQLSGELDRRHRLVASEGSQVVDLSGEQASRYRFRHILLQAYAYSQLDEAERVYLHEAVGNALEQVYAGQTEAIAVQLARHFWAASQMDKAARYSWLAGERARQLYANAEARQHYARALEALARLPDTEENRRRRVDVLIAEASCSWRADSPERILARLAEAEQLVRGLSSPAGTQPAGTREDDRLRLARVLFWMGRVHYTRAAYRDSVPCYQQALSLARESGNTELIAACSSGMGVVMLSVGQIGQAEALAGQAIPLLEKTGNWGEWARALSLHGAMLVHMGDYAKGLAEIHRAYARSKEMNALSEMSLNNVSLAVAYTAGGESPRAVEAVRQVVELAEQSGDQFFVYDGHFCQGHAASRAGQYSTAAEHAAQARAVLQELGGRLVVADRLAALDAEIAFGEGRVQEAIALAKRTVGIAQEMGSIYSEGLARRTWGQALAVLESPQWDVADAQLAESLRLLEAGQARLEAARTHVAWGAVCRERGDLAAARVHWEQAAVQWERSGLSQELARTQALMESLASE